MGIRKLVKYLIVKNPLYEIRLKDIILLKILQEETENQFLTRLLNHKQIKNAITKSGNEYLFAIPYTPKTNNPIEAYFNQIKTYMKKNRNVENYEQLEKNVENAIEKVKPENYKKYFQHAYGMNEKNRIYKETINKTKKIKNL